jgi:transcription initiation factor IIE alpha subunit
MFKFKSKNDQLKEISKKLKQLECDHSRTHFTCHPIYLNNNPNLYSETCSICGKHLALVTEEEKLKKERNRLLSEIRDINNRLNIIEKRKTK